MSATLTTKDSITRTGYTEIEGKKVLQHNCTINTDDPEQMSVSHVKLNKDLYKKHREICRADIAEFEDAAYELQEQYLAQKEVTE